MRLGLSLGPPGGAAGGGAVVSAVTGISGVPNGTTQIDGTLTSTLKARVQK